MIVEIILSLVALTEGYVIWNLFRKTELLENWVENLIIAVKFPEMEM